MKSDKRSILEVQDLGALDEDLGFEFLFWSLDTAALSKG